MNGWPNVSRRIRLGEGLGGDALVDADLQRNTPLPPIDTVIHAQAGIMSYLDIFWMLGMLGLCMWRIALFLPRMPKEAVPAH